MIYKRLQALFHPEQYHGWGRKKKYFEGWYYKIINRTEDQAFAIIPGIAMDEIGMQQAFVQVLDGKKLKAEYYKFKASDFRAKQGEFNLSLAGNRFTSSKIILDLENIKGELSFENQVPWPAKFYSPGIMGPYAFVPFMECYHGILSMDHSIKGKLEINNKVIDFTDGKGYMEKDWGHSFPSAYFWMQSNHFSQPGISFKASVAKIPWLTGSFVGFIAGLWIHDKIIKFTTYNSSRLVKSLADKEKVEIVLENKKFKLKILANRNSSTELSSPISGFMDGRISESMTSEIELQLTDKINQTIIFQDKGRNAGLEVAGKIEEILI